MLSKVIVYLDHRIASRLCEELSVNHQRKLQRMQEKTEERLRARFLASEDAQMLGIRRHADSRLTANVQLSHMSCHHR